LNPVCCIRFVVSGLLYPVCCILFVVSGLLYPVCCIRFVVSGLLYPVCCIRFGKIKLVTTFKRCVWFTFKKPPKRFYSPSLAFPINIFRTHLWHKVRCRERPRASVSSPKTRFMSQVFKNNIYIYI